VDRHTVYLRPAANEKLAKLKEETGKLKAHENQMLASSDE
jgi:hypothetical protein